MRVEAVAGKFYPSGKEELREQIEKSFIHSLGPGELPERKNLPRDIIGGVVPHAGYVFSGYEAAHIYHALAEQEKPEITVLLGPNHHGFGSTVGVSREDWRTPLGTARCDEAAASQLEENCEAITWDENSHRYEHSLEVQLPFLQYIYGDFEFVALSMGLQTLDVAKEVGKCIAGLGKDVLVLASSDFTHFEQAEQAREKDHYAIAAILELDERDFLNRMTEKNITACGYGPIAASMVASKVLGAERAELLKYGNSGDVTGDYKSVVAYAGILFRK